MTGYSAVPQSPFTFSMNGLWEVIRHFCLHSQTALRHAPFCDRYVHSLGLFAYLKGKDIGSFFCRNLKSKRRDLNFSLYILFQIQSMTNDIHVGIESDDREIPEYFGVLCLKRASLCFIRIFFSEKI